MDVQTAVNLATATDEGGNLTVSLEHLDDGSLQIFYYDIGDRPMAMYGDSDYEAWATVAPAYIARLAFALLAEKFAGRTDALSELVKFCREHDIPVDVGVYT